MTATLDTTTETSEVSSQHKADVFLWGPGNELTARDIVNAIGSYLAHFGDNIGPGGVTVFDVIHSEVSYSGDLDSWTRKRSVADIAVIRARAEQLARDYFRRFPALTW